GYRRDRNVRRLVIRRVRLARKDGMVGLQFGRSPVDRLAFDREFLERTARGAGVAATCGRLGEQERGRHSESGDGVRDRCSFHVDLPKPHTPSPTRMACADNSYRQWVTMVS